MTAMKLHVLKPSVNNMAVRVFMRTAKLDFVEDDVYGKTRTPEFLSKNPAHMTPMLEAKQLPSRSACSTHSSWTVSPSSVAPSPRSRTSGGRRRSSFWRSSTTSCRIGSRPSWPTWRSRWARLIANQRPTFAATLLMSRVRPSRQRKRAYDTAMMFITWLHLRAWC